MRISLVILLVLCSVGRLKGQNCSYYKSIGDQLKYRACVVAQARAGHYQYSAPYQNALDRALAIDSTFSHAYRHKSVAYLKSGDFITWRKLMNKAVELEPELNLGYRGWCSFQFFRDYEGAIADFDRLEDLIGYETGYSAAGDYHLQVAKALCLKLLKRLKEAIALLQKHVSQKDYYPGLYDYLHLGTTFMEVGNYQAAIKYLSKQVENNDIAEAHYYLALCYRKTKNTNRAQVEGHTALKLFKEKRSMKDPYVQMVDQVYLSQIYDLF